MPMQKSNNMRGAFITLEGGDGSGKSTQLKLLTEYLQSNGYDCVFTREPGGTAISEKIREIILDGNNVEEANETEALLYAAARAQLVKELIIPSIKQGKIVVCDRYIDSSVAYQGYGRGLPLDILRAMNDFACEALVPDLTILLDVTPETARRRLRGREQATNTAADRIERAGEEFHRRLRQGFAAQAAAEPERIVTVDANGPVAGVQEAIWKLMRRFR